VAAAWLYRDKKQTALHDAIDALIPVEASE